MFKLFPPFTITANKTSAYSKNVLFIRGEEERFTLTIFPVVNQIVTVSRRYIIRKENNDLGHSPIVSMGKEQGVTALIISVVNQAVTVSNRVIVSEQNQALTAKMYCL